MFRQIGCWFALIATAMLVVAPLQAGTITLKNGLQVDGALGKVAKIGESALASELNGGSGIRQIVLADDSLRRVFVPSKMVRTAVEGAPRIMERIKVEQQVAAGGSRIATVGPVRHITKFDDYGRRTFSMMGGRGMVHVVQGITEVAPYYTKVEGLAGKHPYIWDMRIATSSIPRDKLTKVLMKSADEDNPDHRLRIVRLYIEAERFRDASYELEAAQEKFPELEELKGLAVSLRQKLARRSLDEVGVRRDSGQHSLAVRMLKGFPRAGVAGEIELQVREQLNEYESKLQTRRDIISTFEKQAESLTDPDIKEKLEAVAKEMDLNLSPELLVRMADYVRLSDDESLSTDRKLALGVSNWLLGNGEATENLAVALSVFETRNAVQKYLASTTSADREAALAIIETQEAGVPDYLSKILANMKPPVYTPSPTDPEIPGLLTLTTPGLAGEEDIEYLIQLPPEYDEYRKYPTVVTLHGANSNPAAQIDWWCGDMHPTMEIRMGQAARRGYIVIAPRWTKPHKHSYDFTASEHAAVLYSLRDAMKRFSVDSDRVFLSGHSMGGDAAWDIGLAHPDLWAGVMPITATSLKYVSLYWENAKGLPLYFVAGEMDGNRTSQNSRDWNRYLTSIGFDAMVVEYQGRGHEHFQDEILHLFDWMEVHRRDFAKKEFSVTSMRPWDNYFWWLEVDEFPPTSIVLPVSWPDTSVRAAKTNGSFRSNRFTVRSTAKKMTIWLSPELVDFDERIYVNGRAETVEPDIRVLLEDVRTRGDRQHPFWAKIEK
ncbi:MAG: alpha/beta hydrolase-fold protein [bacterium]|nr:alpha/beta hydrolase-fold protein [bacterium]